MGKNRASQAPAQDARTMTEKQVKLIEILLDGLTIDGGHHKQWYLEQALKSLTTEFDFNELKSSIDWEEGIP